MIIELEDVSPAKEWFQGLIDLHCYARPCVFERGFSIPQLAKQYCDVGYRAMLVKSHFDCNCDAVEIAREMVTGIEIYGGVVLNWSVGGLNPHAVDAAILLGAKEVWMGNMHAGTLSTEPFRTNYGYELSAPDSPWVTRTTKSWMIAPPINVIDLKTGELLPVVYDVLGLIAEADIILGSCHISKRECFALVPEARKAGVKKIVITHPAIGPHPYLGPNPSQWRYWSIDELKKIAEMGAVLEHVSTMYVPYRDQFDILAQTIKTVGANKCVLASDCGSTTESHPIEAMRQFILNLRRRGITEQEIDVMTKKNPVKLLGLE